MAQEFLVSLFNIEAPRSYSDTPQSVGLLWTSDQLDAETTTTQHTTLTTDRHRCPQTNSNPESLQTSGRSPRFFRARPLGSAKLYDSKMGIFT